MGEQAHVYAPVALYNEGSSIYTHVASHLGASHAEAMRWQNSNITLVRPLPRIGTPAISTVSAAIMRSASLLVKRRAGMVTPKALAGHFLIPSSAQAVSGVLLQEYDDSAERRLEANRRCRNWPRAIGI
jgi:hypothetical protein